MQLYSNYYLVSSCILFVTFFLIKHHTALLCRYVSKPIKLHVSS